MTIEEKIRDAVEILRKEKPEWRIESFIDQAIIDGGVDEWRDNPNKFGGTEPGNLTIRVFEKDGCVTDFCKSDILRREHDAADAMSIAQTIKRSLAIGYDPKDDAE